MELIAFFQWISWLFTKKLKSVDQVIHLAQINSATLITIQPVTEVDTSQNGPVKSLLKLNVVIHGQKTMKLQQQRKLLFYPFGSAKRYARCRNRVWGEARDLYDRMEKELPHGIKLQFLHPDTGSIIERGELKMLRLRYDRVANPIFQID